MTKLQYPPTQTPPAQLSEVDKWRLYEEFKRTLRGLDLTPAKYDRLIAAEVARLEI